MHVPGTYRSVDGRPVPQASGEGDEDEPALTGRPDRMEALLDARMSMVGRDHRIAGKHLGDLGL
jgi:hypothetical protein